MNVPIDQSRANAPGNRRVTAERTPYHASLREIFSLDEPADRIGRAVRRVQIDQLIRLVPATVGVQLLTAAVLVAAVRGSINSMTLGLWFGTSLLFCFMRGLRAARLRLDPDYRRDHPASFASVSVIVSILAALWLVPSILWFDDLTHDQRLFLCVLVAALLSAGSMTLVNIPPAAAAYILLMALGAVSLTVQLGSVPMLLLSLLYAAVLLWGVVANARQSIAHARARLALEEQGEIIALLREFQASGSGGLWELDGELKLVTISHELAEAIGHRAADLVGVSVKRIVDPLDRIVQVSTGMRTLFEHFDDGVAFRDLAVPAPASERWWSLSGKPIRDSAGVVTGWRGVGSDITALRLSGDDAVRAARSDPLTGIANRLLIRELLEDAMLRQIEAKSGCALLLIDLDRFKMVNDTLGHAIGDQLLCQVATRLEATVGEGGRVGRLGGDEFAVIWSDFGHRQDLAALADRLVAELSRAYVVGAASIHVGASIGIAVGPDDGVREDTLMRSADLALYRAKEAGRGGHAFFQAAMFEEAEDHRLLENDVREALRTNALTLAYQPIVDARSGAVVGREALLRWRHPFRGDIAPDLFVPIIEDAGLIHQIGDWVIREACAEAASWPQPVRIAVNISAAQLTGPGLAKTVVGALAATGLPPGLLELEVTESVFLGDDAETLASLERLRSLGVRLVLDDFGKGYSSFGYLSRARFAKIKIDQSFVRGAAEGSRECLAIVHAILALARGLGVETTAEGVETEHQATTMTALGCNQLQGYYYGRPAAATAAGPMLRRRA